MRSTNAMRIEPARPRIRTWISVAALAALACGPRIQVTTLLEPGADFSRYHTYALVPPPEARDSVREILESEVAEELEAHGYRRAAIGGSDLLVVIQGRTQTRERRVFAESPGGCCAVDEYLAGTLVIQIFDAGSSQRLWRGVGEVDIRSEDEKDVRHAASDAAAAILAKLPHHP